MIKVIKLLFVAVFCMAVAAPVMAQEVKSKADVGNKIKIPVEETAEVCKDCVKESIPDFSNLIKGAAAPVVNNSGQKGAFTYYINVDGGNGWYAEMANEDKGYTLSIETWMQDGELKRFKSCVGNETYCKAITNGKACPEEGPSEEWCFLGEAPLAK